MPKLLLYVLPLYLMLVVWANAKTLFTFTKHPQFRSGNAALYYEAVYHDLATCGIVPPEHQAEFLAEPNPKNMARAFSKFDGKVIGVMLCKPAFCPSLYDVVDDRQQVVMDFWNDTAYHADPFLFHEVLEAAPFCESQTAYEEHGRTQRTGLFYQMTIASHERLIAAAVQGGEEECSAQMLLATWAAKYADPTLASRSLRCSHAPTPHAILLACGK